MAHVRRAYTQGLFTPTIDLGRSGSPKNVVEKDITSGSASITRTARHYKGHVRPSVKCGRLDRGTQESVRELASPTVHMSGSLMDRSTLKHTLSTAW